MWTDGDHGQTKIDSLLEEYPYLARDEGGAYRGTLEVSQDLTALRAFEGERRLLDWD